MKRPLKHYAIALYDAVKTPGAKLADVTSNFIKVLHNDGVLSKAEKIFSLFRAHWNATEREVDITMTSAHPVTAAQQKHIGDAIERALHMQKHTVHATIDPALLGGVVVRYEDTVLDGSVRRQLSQIKTALQE